ncbi:MAG: hypothetical protein AAF687_05710 [Pseudomonadota bacterium]
MRGFLTITAAALLTTPAQANQPPPESDAVVAAADAFFEALRNPDKTALSKELLNEAVIFVHDRRDPENPRTMIVPAGQHLEGWLTSAPGVDEYMSYDSVLVDGTMAHVWGPYTFLVNGKTTHCGVNSMSMVKTEDGWKVGNTSFTMVSPEDCETVGASRIQLIPEQPGE